MVSINADDVVDEELDELERRLEGELQAREGQEEEDGGAGALIRLRDLTEEVQGTHEDHGLHLRHAQNWLDDWTQSAAYGTMLDVVVNDYRAKLPAETRAQVEQARAHMAAAVEELTAAVWALRDYSVGFC